MIEREINTDVFWHERFAVTDQDMEDLGVLFLEAERPLTSAELAKMLIGNYCRREESKIRRRLASGSAYRPNGTFEVGETLVFPHLDFAIGTVVDLRDGHNPEYDDFKVITIRLQGDGNGKTRHFAAEFLAPHKLAFDDESSLESALVPSSEALYGRFGELVRSKLERQLKASAEFVAFRDQWLVKAMLADVHVGLLNIAEAMLDVEGQPMVPRSFLGELELPAEIPESIQVFSLNLAMSQDRRFEDVGDAQQLVWALRRWLPESAVVPPERLSYQPVPYDRTSLDVTHLQIEREIDDEASQVIAPPTAADARALTLLLSYPHWRCGTLPLTARTRALFPKGKPGQRTRITFVDGRNSKEFSGWAVHGQGYVAGLGDWYASNDILAGSYIRLERTDDSHRVGLDVIPRRMQREWVRVASRSAGGELTFEMRKRPVACEYDEFCLLDESDPKVVDELWRTEQTRSRSLPQIATATYLELAKLNPGLAVHAKTLYAGINVIKRCPPGLLFATLFAVPQLVTSGDGYWKLQAGTDTLG